MNPKNQNQGSCRLRVECAHGDSAHVDLGTCREEGHLVVRSGTIVDDRTLWAARAEGPKLVGPVPLTTAGVRSGTMARAIAR